MCGASVAYCGVVGDCFVFQLCTQSSSICRFFSIFSGVVAQAGQGVPSEAEAEDVPKQGCSWVAAAAAAALPSSQRQVHGEVVQEALLQADDVLLQEAKSLRKGMTVRATQCPDRLAHCWGPSWGGFCCGVAQK